MSEILSHAGFIAGLVVYYLVAFASVLSIPFGIPGEFGVLIATVVFTALAGASWVPWWISLILFILCLFAEGVEALAGFVGAKQAKGSVASAFGALAGGFAGAIIGAPFGLIFGSLAGALIGTFGGAFGVEYLRTKSHEGSSRVAAGALLGRIIGSVVKTAVACAMIALVTLMLVLAAVRQVRAHGPGDSGETRVERPRQQDARP